MIIVDYYASKLGRSTAEIMAAAMILRAPVEGEPDKHTFSALTWNESVLGPKPSGDDLAEIDALPEPALTAAQLGAYAKAKRDETEAAGITVNGVAIASDTDSQNRVNNAYNGMIVSGVASIPFKSGSGFVTLTLEQVKSIGVALFAHTQACFSAEDRVDDALSATPPTITTRAEVDAVFAAVKSAY